ncbi:MAG: hypothetical protein RL341_1991, partial [Pseudomonadota bacterium]
MQIGRILKKSFLVAVLFCTLFGNAALAINGQDLIPASSKTYLTNVCDQPSLTSFSTRDAACGAIYTALKRIHPERQTACGVVDALTTVAPTENQGGFQCGMNKDPGLRPSVDANGALICLPPYPLQFVACGGAVRYTCPPDSVDQGNGTCDCKEGFVPVGGQCVPKQDKTTCNIAHPVKPATGAKVLNFVAYEGAGSAPLNLAHFYNSQAVAMPGLALRVWRHSFDRQVVKPPSLGADLNTRLVTRADGILDVQIAAVGGNVFSSALGFKDTLAELKDTAGLTTGYTYNIFEDDSVETYSAAGQLQSIKARNGWTTTLTYSDATTPVANYLSGSTVAQP